MVGGYAKVVRVVCKYSLNIVGVTIMSKLENLVTLTIGLFLLSRTILATEFPDPDTRKFKMLKYETDSVAPTVFASSDQSPF
jgi:hypothetical protein